MTSVHPARTVPRVVIDIRAHPTGATLTLWRSTIGKKAVMAVTGLVMVLFLLVHMLGNLKIFFGPNDFDAYAAWLRTIGEPVLRGRLVPVDPARHPARRRGAACRLRGAAVQT